MKHDKEIGTIIELNGEKYISLVYHESCMNKKPKEVTKEIIRKEIVHKQDNKIRKKIDELKIEAGKYVPIRFGYDYTPVIYSETIKILEGMI